MVDPPGNWQRPATLEDLAALNREMAALVRAGVPLEESLAQFADDFERGPASIAARLHHETTAGKSLAEAIAAQGNSLPLVYRAVVEAGLKSGRLAAALEGFAETTARLADMRRIAAQSATYPLIVVVLAIVMAIATTSLVLPRYEWLSIDDRIWASPLAMSRQAVVGWMVATPIVAAIVAVFWWRRSSSSLGASGPSAAARLVPGAGRAVYLSGQASFAELLGLLVSCRVPLNEALPLAASTSGIPRLQDAAAELSAGLTRGRPLVDQLPAARGLPPLVRCALLTAPNDDGLRIGLARAAEVYRERAEAWVARMAVLAPIVASLAVGSLVVGVYALLLLQPYVAALKETASWQ